MDNIIKENTSGDGFYDPFGESFNDSASVKHSDNLVQPILEMSNIDKNTTDYENMKVDDTPRVYSDEEVILSSLISNTSLTANLKYLENTLTQENYIIYFYAREFYNRGVKVLTRRGLSAAIESNAIYWLQKNSIINRRSKGGRNRLDSEYLSVATGKTLYTESDCCEALKFLVLKRYDKISKVHIPDTEEEMLSVVEGQKLTAQVKFAEDVAFRCYNLLSGDVQRESIDSVYYESGDILDFIKDLSTYYLNILNGSVINSNQDSYQDYLRQMCSSISTTDIVFKWNIGEPILSDPLKGWLLTLNAPPKQGKTRFAIGEMVYPALKAGRNVDYYSGEMKIKDVVSLLIVKYLYTEHNMDFSQKKLYNWLCIALQISAKLQLKKNLTPTEEKALKEMGKDFLSLVLIAQNDVLGENSKFGKLRVISLTDDESSSSRNTKIKTRMEQQFIVENLEYNIMTSIENRAEEFRPDMIVFDHAGHFSSSGKLSQTECFREVYAIGHKLAGNKLHPFLNVIINHTATDQGEKAKTSDKLDGATLRAFGTSEAGKSADVDISLISTPDQEKDGQMSLVINFDRWNNQSQMFKTNHFTMNVNKGRCEYTLTGASKTIYPTKDEIDDKT